MKNKTKLGRFGVLFLALVLFVCNVPVGMRAIASSWLDITDTVPDGANVIATQSGNQLYSIWHYSGGYWARTSSDPLRIYDNQLSGNIEQLAEHINHTIQFDYALPQEVQTALAAGRKVGVAVSAPAGYDYFNTAKGQPQIKIENGRLYFQAYPIFHFVPAGTYNYSNFVSGLNAFIPFVDPKYGCNVYSMFTTSNTIVAVARGHFEPFHPNRLGSEGRIHPSQIANLGSTTVTTTLDFSIPNLTSQQKDVTLAAGQSRVVSFIFSTPASGSFPMTAEANKERTFTEDDYSNNKLSVTAQITPVPSLQNSCNDVIQWLESASHTVRSSYWDSTAGRSVTYAYTCYHNFTYEARLTSTYDITPKTLKSGYGFAVTLNNNISTRMLRNQGCSSWGSGRANSKIPSPPDKAQVKLGWTVRNRLGTQPSTVELNMLSRTATQSRFEPRQNPISEIKSKLIYTDVALAGTRQSPRQHQISISITGGGVNGIPFCRELSDRITINGNMYEDDATGAN